MKGRTLKEGKRGFTLVELIVVIAILAILAAVAYPVYTGYIAKANEAADQVLIGAVNEAYRSALYDVGYNDGTLPEEANATLRQKKVADVQVIIPDDIDINDTFFKYFEGNEEKKFKVVEGLLYSPSQGFYASLNGGNKILFGGGNSLVNKGTGADGYTEWEWEKDGQKYTIKTKGQELEMFSNSSFGQNMTMGSLMDEVNTVASAAADILKGGSIPIFFEAAEEELTPYLEKAGIEKGAPGYEDALANAFVLGAADILSGYSSKTDADTVEALYKVALGGKLGGANFSIDAAHLGVGTAAGYAFEYTVMTGFANSQVGQNTKISDPENPSEQITLQEYHNRMTQKLTSASKDEASQILKDINTTMRNTSEFQSYMEEHGREDVEGIVAAMRSISNNADTLAKSGVLASGFADDGVKDVLSAIFGG